MPVCSFVFLLDRHIYISLKTDNFTFLPSLQRLREETCVTVSVGGIYSVSMTSTDVCTGLWATP